MSKHNYIIRSSKDRHPYIKNGNYWLLFGHLYQYASDALRERMDAMRKADEDLSLSTPGAHYPKSRLQ